MIADAEALLYKVEEHIRSCASRSDFAAVSRLAELARTIQSKLTEAQNLRASLESVRREIDAVCGGVIRDRSNPPLSSRIGSPKPFTEEQTSGGKLTVTVRWPGVGASDLEEVFARSTAAETMRSFLERAWTVMGDREFERLASVRTGRGPLVTKSPTVDYINKSTGAVYTHHRIADSQWHVITHSETREKIDQLREAVRLLRLKDASIKIGKDDLPRTIPRPPDISDDGRI